MNMKGQSGGLQQSFDEFQKRFQRSFREDSGSFRGSNAISGCSILISKGFNGF